MKVNVSFPRGKKGQTPSRPPVNKTWLGLWGGLEPKSVPAGLCAAWWNSSDLRFGELAEAGQEGVNKLGEAAA